MNIRFLPLDHTRARGLTREQLVGIVAASFFAGLFAGAISIGITLTQLPT